MHAPRMDDLESETWLALLRVIELLPAALDAQLQRDSNLTHFEFFALSVLRFAPGATLRMTELATDTNSSLTRLSHVAKRLEERGLVERFPCPEDRRATNVRLTADGRRELVRAVPKHIELARASVIDAIGPDKLADFRDALRIVGDQLEPRSTATGAGRRRSPFDVS